MRYMLIKIAENFSGLLAIVAFLLPPALLLLGVHRLLGLRVETCLLLVTAPE